MYARSLARLGRPGGLYCLSHMQSPESFVSCSLKAISDCKAKVSWLKEKPLEDDLDMLKGLDDASRLLCDVIGEGFARVDSFIFLLFF